MGNMNKYMAYNEMRRRDNRGRYMDGGQGGNMTYNSYNRRNSNDTAHFDPYGRPMAPRSYRDDVGRDRPDYGHDMRGEGYFTWDMDDDPMSNVTNMRDYSPGMSMGGGHQRKQQIGFHQQNRQNNGGEACLTREDAEEWVRSMEAADEHSRSGGKWNWETAKTVAQSHGIPTEGQEMIDFYAAINMVYSDYCKVARDHKVATEDFFADLAMAFLYDRDGVEPSEKIYGYYMCLTDGKK